ncbi:hypothetical protein AB6C47_018325 [Vibrio cyclitrophicus]
MGEVTIAAKVKKIRNEINKSNKNTLKITTLQSKHLCDLLNEYRSKYNHTELLELIDSDFELYSSIQNNIEKIIGLPYQQLKEKDGEDKLWTLNSDNVEDVLMIIVANYK